MANNGVDHSCGISRRLHNGHGGGVLGYGGPYCGDDSDGGEGGDDHEGKEKVAIAVRISQEEEEAAEKDHKRVRDERNHGHPSEILKPRNPHGYGWFSGFAYVNSFGSLLRHS